MCWNRMQNELYRISRRWFIRSTAVGLAAAGFGRLFAQNDTTFSTDVKVVSVLAAVHEKGGKIVSNLTKDDFDLSEDGRPQTIKYFSRETDLPLTLGLLVDTSTSQRTVLGDEKSASYRFFEHVLRPDRDQAFVLHFDFDVELLQDVTPSREKLEKAIGQVGLARQDQPQMRRGRGGGRRGGGTTLYDSILLASNEIMKNQKGRKALILLTDGVDNGSKVPLSEAVEAAQRADTLVYSILFTGEEPQFSGFGGGRGGGRRGGSRYPQPQQQRGNGKKVLQQISAETGGAFFEVSKKLPIDQIYDRIEEELRNQYSLGYTSDKTDALGFRKITVSVKQKNMIVQTREGYYPQ
jgi:VWFA-related protein